jgi:Sulfotransferase family
MTSSPEPPDFFIVGHHKSGTTALYEMLRRHPQIYMPELKEPKFFASDMPARFEPPSTGVLPATLEQYLALFEAAQPGQRKGEASPSYLTSRTAAAEIAQVQPEARIIAILREPASFLRSLHLQLLQSGVETEKDLRKAIANELVIRQGRNIHRFTDQVHYVEQLRRYNAVFSNDQVLVIVYDDFRADNEATVRRVLRFLEVDDSVPVPTLESNPTVRVRSLRLNNAVGALAAGRGPVAGAANGAIKSLIPRSLRRWALRATHRSVVYGKPEPPDERVMLELRRRFQPEVAALSEYLGRDLLTLWGYDGLG